MGRILSPAAAAESGLPLLLDTHVWLWYLDGDRERIRGPIEKLLRAAGRDRRLRVSDISVWEIATKCAKGRLELAVAPAVWIRRAEAVAAVSLLPLSRDVLLESTLLPGEAPGDPADRMIVATALVERIPLVTADRAIHAYARGRNGLSVVPLRI